METRLARFDPELQIEAYYFSGLQQKFPNHFHDYYVIGCIESGKRHLSCQNQDYEINAGDLILFNPGQNHACEQIGQHALEYRSIHITPMQMERITQDILGQSCLPQFKQVVITQYTQIEKFQQFHRMIMQTDACLYEEHYYALLGELLHYYADHIRSSMISPLSDIKLVCQYLTQHYAERITLEDLSQLTGTNKYTLIRSFTKQTGVTPYQYLETIRINQAKKLLEQAVALIDIAQQTGFSDQSHFSRYFKQFVGLTPKQYQEIFTE